MSNPPIVTRDNPLARKLGEIAALNQAYGTRAEGGGAPIVPAEPPAGGSGGTVLPPDPKPLSPEEEAQLEADFNRDWGHAQENSPGPVQRPPVEVKRPQIAVGKLPDGFAAIDLVHNQIVATNGLVFPIREEEKQELLQFAFKAFMRATDEQIERMAGAMGMKISTKRRTRRDAQAVPAVPAGEASQGLQPESSDGGRPELAVPPVPSGELQSQDGDGPGRSAAVPCKKRTRTKRSKAAVGGNPKT